MLVSEVKMLLIYYFLEEGISVKNLKWKKMITLIRNDKQTGMLIDERYKYVYYTLRKSYLDIWYHSTNERIKASFKKIFVGN